MIGLVGKPRVHTKTCAKNWIKFFPKLVHYIVLLLLRCLIANAVCSSCRDSRNKLLSSELIGFRVVMRTLIVE